MQDDDIYDEVDEAEYHAKFRDREFEDEFVVDDDGSGYVDYGQDDFGEPYFGSSDEDAEQKGINICKHVNTDNKSIHAHVYNNPYAILPRQAKEEKE